MSDKAGSLPYCTADYLHTREDIAEYLTAVIEENDAQLLGAALHDVATAISRQPHLVQDEIRLAEPPNLAGLFAVLRALDLKITVRPRREAA